MSHKIKQLFKTKPPYLISLVLSRDEKEQPFNIKILNLGSKWMKSLVERHLCKIAQNYPKKKYFVP